MKIEFDKRLELIYGILYCVNKEMNNDVNVNMELNKKWVQKGVNNDIITLKGTIMIYLNGK